MHRFFLTSEDELSVPSAEIRYKETTHHMLKSLRMTLGEVCELITAQGDVYEAEIDGIDSVTGHVHLTSLTAKATAYESPVEIDLYQCLPKGQKLELIVQKNVELGVKNIYLVESKRCIVDFKHKDVDKKLERYRKIAVEAAKQSKRTMIPDIVTLMPIKALEKAVPDYDLCIVLYEDEHQQTLKPLLKDKALKRIAVVVGPEGGFEPSEIEALKSYGAQIVTLGNRILRTETAGLAAITCIQYEIGDLS